jgi:hypothetical protein
MKLYRNANKYFSISVVLLIILLPIQVLINISFVPNFVQNSNAKIIKNIFIYGEEIDDKKSRKIYYRLKPYIWNRFILLASIKFDSGENKNAQFLITFLPKNVYSIKHTNKLVEAQETKYFDLPEQHVLFDGNEENFQVLVENSYRYCYIQLSSSSVQCVDIHENNEK